MSQSYFLALGSDSASKGQYFQEIKSSSDKNELVDLTSLGPIQKLNIIVGSTNSGKSRLMRRIMEQKSLIMFRSVEFIDLLHDIRNSCKELSAAVGVTFPVFKATQNHNVHWATKDGQPPETVRESGIYDAMRDSLLGTKRVIEFDKKFFSQILGVIETILDIGTRAANEKGVIDDTALKTVQQSLAGLQMIQIAEQVSPVRRLIDITPHISPETLGTFITLIRMLNILTGQLKGSESETVACSGSKRIYIPVLRTAIPLKDVSTGNYVQDNLFSHNVIQNYSIGSTVDIFTGLELYQTILMNNADEQETRDRLKTFYQFLSQNFFDGKNVEITSIHESHKKGRRIMFSVDGIERPLHNLGDGIQALIIIMYKLFMAPVGTWVFIEEPEVNLHPGLQRIIVETILHNRELADKNLTIFMTSHSNHLLDISIPEYERVAIFSLERRIDNKKETFIVRAVNNNRLHALTSLGVANSSVFMSNCSIWVEGITDRMYIRSFLQSYRCSEEFSKREGARSYQEDIHFSFFEYAGSNLEHYIFPGNDAIPGDAQDDDEIKGQFLANRVFLIADRDNGKSKKHSRWEGQKYKHFIYYVTQGKEIENLISSTILIALLKNGFTSYIKASDVDGAAIKAEEYQTVGLGAYLVDKFKIQEGLAESSGTLNAYYKSKMATAFCQYINQLMNDKATVSTCWTLLSDEAQALTRKIYNFIESHNANMRAD